MVVPPPRHLLWLYSLYQQLYYLPEMKIKKTREIQIFLNLKKKVNVKRSNQKPKKGADVWITDFDKVTQYVQPRDAYYLKIRSFSNLKFIQTLSICLEFSPFLVDFQPLAFIWSLLWPGSQSHSYHRRKIRRNR